MVVNGLATWQVCSEWGFTGMYISILQLSRGGSLCFVSVSVLGKRCALGLFSPGSFLSPGEIC